MNKNSENLYTNLNIDIPTLHGVLIEKFKEPVVSYWAIRWNDRNDELHSFNGFPSCIERSIFNRVCYLRWHKHGKEIKSLTVQIIPRSEIIAEKIKARDFQERAKKREL